MIQSEKMLFFFVMHVSLNDFLSGGVWEEKGISTHKDCPESGFAKAVVVGIVLECGCRDDIASPDSFFFLGRNKIQCILLPSPVSSPNPATH